MKRLIFTIAAFGCASLAAPAHAQEWSAEQSEAWTFVSSAWAEHTDPGTWHEDLDPAGYGWNNQYPVPTSRDQMAARTRVFGSEGEVLYYRLDPIKITVSGDTAIAYYFANIVETDHEGERDTSVERCADTLVKRSGEWRFLGWMCESTSAGSDD
ncbi:hypothetical protein [Erythrobacter alti]|uniref:hypothetical protein n=1 Tax=Erythrobacter alti TaxID=1896145 RepID=UPI0030F40044